MKKRYKNTSKIKTGPKKTVTGILHGNSRGFAFLCGDGYEDIFIPAFALGQAMHGDTVEVDVYSDHGEVKKILKSGPSEITGTYYKDMRGGKVVPDDKHYSRDILVMGGSAVSGERVVIKLSRKDRRKGEIIARLGQADSLESSIAAIVFSLGIKDFGYKAINEAEKEADQEFCINGRTDFRSQSCFTIDGEDSKDFDDAVYAEEINGEYRLWVHIADVAHYVPLYSHVDKEAFRRGNSFYYGESVLPMLPNVLCNGICSLNENEPRLTLTVIMDISTDGEVVGGEVCEGVICSHKRMTYEKVEAALNGETSEYAQFEQTLFTLHKIRDLLKKRRDEAGNIDFDISEPQFSFEQGKVISVRKKPRLISHSIIEECMIAANRFIAAKFLSLKEPIIYREHQPPQQEKLDELNAFLASIGEKAIKTNSKDIADLLRNVAPEKSSAVSRMTLRCMSKAKYSVYCNGHFGLALNEYCHFTSPIRRYSDLAVHRVVKAYLHGESTEALAEIATSVAAQASEREKLTERAEREIDELYIADYMSRFVGKEFEGIISGVTEWGVYVELDNTAEGMIKAESMGNTRFISDTVSMFVHGKGIFSLGDSIKVVLVSASEGNILFELA